MLSGLAVVALGWVALGSGCAAYFVSWDEKHNDTAWESRAVLGVMALLWPLVVLFTATWCVGLIVRGLIEDDR